VLDAELGQRPADLGQLILGDVLPRLGRDEVMARPVGVQRAWQTPRAEHLGERLEGAHGAFFVDQKGRVDLGGGIIHGHDQVELLVQRRQPAVR
jgi:hypothetical protein